MNRIKQKTFSFSFILFILSILLISFLRPKLNLYSTISLPFATKIVECPRQPKS